MNTNTITKTTTTLLLMLAVASASDAPAPASNGLRSYKDAHLPLNGSLPHDTAAQQFSGLKAVMWFLKKCTPSLFGSKWSSNVSGVNGNALWGKNPGVKLPESVLANPEAYKLTSIEAWTCDLSLKRNFLTKTFMWALTIWERSGLAGGIERMALRHNLETGTVAVVLDILNAHDDLENMRMAIENLEHWFLICKFAGPNGETVFARVEKAEFGMKITDGKDFQKNGAHGASRVRNIYGQDYTLNTSARQGITLSTVIGLCDQQRQATYNIIKSNCRQFAKWIYNQVTDSDLIIPTLEQMDRIEHHQYTTPQKEKEVEKINQAMNKALSILKK